MTRECAQCSPYGTPSGQRNHVVMLRPIERLISPCLNPASCFGLFLLKHWTRRWETWQKPAEWSL